MNPDPQIPFWSREKLAAFARQNTQAAERAERIAVPRLESKFLEEDLVLATEMFAGKTAESTLLENASSAVGDFAPGNAGKLQTHREKKS